jgi:hypothetical protein
MSSVMAPLSVLYDNTKIAVAKICGKVGSGQRECEGQHDPEHTICVTSELGGGVRPIRTRLCMGRMAVPYSAQRPRHSARAAARLSLKFGLV